MTETNALFKVDAIREKWVLEGTRSNVGSYLSKWGGDWNDSWGFKERIVMVVTFHETVRTDTGFPGVFISQPATKV